MNPLRRNHTVTIGGSTYELHLELFDWARAQDELSIDLLPFGKTPFWSSPGIHQNAVLLYLMLKRSLPEVTLSWIYDHYTFETENEISESLGAALRDFFLSLGVVLPGAEETTVEEQEAEMQSSSSGPSPDTISDSQTMSSGDSPTESSALSSIGIT